MENQVDKGLLELAAAAAGWKIKLVDSKVERGRLFCFRIKGGEQKPWNPLDNDGDALRLAVLLNLPVPTHWDKDLVLPNGLDAYGATRYAIVRAAADLALARQNI